jgi:hypothetical protein
VDGALDGFLGRGGRVHLGLFLLGDQHLLGAGHHGANGRGLGFSRLAAACQIFGLGVVLGGLVGGLDHAQHGLGWLHRLGGLHPLGRLGRGSGHRRRAFGRRSGGGGSRRSSSGGSRRSSSGSGSSGSRFGSGARRRFGSGGFCGFTGGTLGFFALAPGFGQVFFLLADGFGLGARFFLAALQVEVFLARARGFFDTGRRVVALHEDTLLAHLHLNRARAAAGVGLLDFGVGLARQRDLLALGANDGAMGGAQEVEQALLVGLGERVVG